MASLKESLKKTRNLDGFIGACIVDSNSGLMLDSEKGDTKLNLSLAAVGNTEIVRAKRTTMRNLGLKDSLEDILITLGTQYHLIRLLPQKDGLFVYLILDKARGNLAMARYMLSEISNELEI
ncbi:MAG: hypothetical protein L3J84_13790 [Gammaproteobacteria bacterium]|nr:hypothetical protein [Gammaproteobacteria bacterium]